VTDEFVSTLKTNRTYPVRLVLQRKPAGIALAVREFDYDSTTTRHLGLLTDAQELAAWLVAESHEAEAA
jgi:hypothetical protein